jgi:N-acetylmuramoyl-L-alanine amidase
MTNKKACHILLKGMRWMPTSAFKHPLFLILAAFFVVFALFGSSQAIYAMGEITVEANILNVRSGPGLDYKVIGQISNSETYRVLEEKNSWYKIRINSDQDGWVASWLVQIEKTTGSIKQVESTVNPLNVRSGPGTSFQVITQVRPEQTFPFVKEEGDWIQIELNDQEKGWVAKWLIKIKEADVKEVSQVRETATVQVPILNVRSGPNTSYSVIGKLTSGEKIEIIEVKQGWYKISFNLGDGWVASDYVDEKGTASEAPTSESPDKKKVKVSATILNVRSSSSLDADVIDKLSQGDVIEVIRQDGEWFEISYQGKQGWVANWLVEEVNHSLISQPTITILNAGTNLRSGPGLDFGVVSRVDQGDTFAVIGTEGEWFQIVLDDGKTAFVAGWIVSAEGVPNVERQTIQTYLKGKKIVIDPGHGGKDNGATGSHFKTIEKVVNLQLSSLLKAKFEAAGSTVAMTRTSDRFVSLQNRVDLSINEKSDIFLSIHHNTHHNTKINGTITYFYTDKEDRKLANLIQGELIKNNGLNDLKARKGNFFVLRENPRLGVLIELGFLTNYNDELTIRQNKFQENSANGILHGVAKYFKDKEA